MDENLGGKDLSINVDAAGVSPAFSCPESIPTEKSGVSSIVDGTSLLGNLTDAEIEFFTIPALDDASSPIEYLKLTSELMQLLPKFVALKASDELADKVALMKVTARAMEIQKLLGGNARAEAEPAPDTSIYFEFNQDIKPSQRQKDNRAAINLLADIKQGKVDGATLTGEQKQILAKYSGNGGGMTGADGLSGSQYEYYTPKPLAQGIWSLMEEMGFAGGKVLDPSAGTGIFGATSPKSAVIDAIELDETSGMVNKLVNGSAKNNVTISAFEAIAANTPDETYDAIVTNVPFGDNSARGKEKLKDPRYQSESLEAYFILRSLEKLRPNGLACFVTSKAFVANASENRLRYRASLKAEFLGAYRLPNKMFDAAGADVTTDVIVFRKFSREASEKIQELVQQNPDKLHECNVLWDEFLVGGYFKGEGKRFILGKTEMGKGRFGDVEKVMSDDSIANISRLLRKFPDSRIDWQALNAAPTAPIVYSDGDAIAVAGRTMTYKNGVFVPVPLTEQDVEIVDINESLFSPLQAVNKGATWADAAKLHKYLTDKADYKNIPTWIKSVVPSISSSIVLADQAAVFDALKTAFALQDVVNQHVTEEPFNYAEAYPELSKSIRLNVKNVKRIPSSVPKQVRDVASLLGIWYIAKTQSFRDRWLGTSLAEVVINELKPTQKYELAKYEAANDAGFVPLDHLTEVMGEGFDPLESNEWCVSGDGKGVMSADDYYAGNYADFIAKNNQEIEQTSDPVLREKLVRQRQNAQDRLIRTDISALTLNLNTPYVDVYRKVEFLRKYVHPGFSVLANGNAPEIAFDGKKAKGMTDSQLRNMKRFADYLKRGVLSTLTDKDEKAANANLDALRTEQLKQLITQTNQKFDAWSKSNTGVQSSLKAQFDNPQNLFFREVDDNSPLAIDGLNQGFQPHDYQNAAIRRYAKRMSGILGFDVGLGKTATSLITIQHIQSIGAKKKTVFVVPNSTLTNWRKETISCYKSVDDCLFVGLDVDTDGNAAMNSSNYARDLNTILENKHRKIFMTYEAFNMIPLRANTIEEYESYLGTVDYSYNSGDSNSKAAAIAKEGKLKGVTKIGAQGSAAVPFFEDMGIDSLVTDEGHSFKNSKETVDFKQAKFLSDPSTSDRGMDMQMKTWYIRGKSKLKDGVLILTATPITNSPLEIYSMLTLAVGEEEVNRRMGGVRGADAFMEAFCDISEEEVTSLAGTDKLQRVFRGLQNTNLLRDVLGQICNIKTAKEVDLKIPDADEIATSVELPPDVVAQLQMLQKIYSIASKMARGNKDVLPEEEELVARYQAISKEPIDLIGHPFNFINKVSKLIADPELARQTTVYVYNDSQADIAEKAVAEFNGKKFTEERNRPSLTQDESSILSRKIKKSGADSGQDDVEVLKVLVVAKIAGDKIVIDTENIDTQNKFLKIADKLKLNLDVTISPKLAAFLDNFQAENGNPRGKGKAKQLVFCDMLSLHNKLKIMLKNRCGIDPGKIVIVNGVTISDAADMQDTQDGFNAEGEENKYRVVVANKKAEVGVNYQKGTQAIHHLTVGWTPDSIHQRNGRGVRQGNYVGRVAIYHYDADGTFDEYKRSIVSKKADWIGELMANNGSNKVKIAGGISNSDVEMLAEAAGSAEGMRKVREKIARREVVERKRAAKDALTANIETMLAQREIIAKYPTANAFLAEMVADAAEAYQALRSAAARKSVIDDSDDSKAIGRATDALAKAQASYDRLIAPIKASLAPSYGANTIEKQFDSYGWLEHSRGSRVRDKVSRDNIINDVSRNALGTFKILEASIVMQEWQQEVSIAESLATDSEAKARTLCADAGVSFGRIDQAKAGQSRIIRGQIVGTGDFVIDRNDTLWVVSNGETSELRSIGSDDFKGRVSDNSVLFTGKIITQEHPDQEVYFETVSRAVDIDNALIKRFDGGLPKEGLKYLYSAYNLDVRAKLAIRPNLRVRAEVVRFDAPKYQYVIKSGADKSIALIKSIADSQAPDVTLVGGEYGKDDVLVDEAVRVEQYGMPQTADVTSELVKYAIANGFQVSVAAVNAAAYSISTEYSIILYLKSAMERSGKRVNEADLAQSIMQTQSVDELDSLMLSTYRTTYSALDWEDPAISASLSNFYSYSVKNVYGKKYKELTEPPKVEEVKQDEVVSAIESGASTEVSPPGGNYVAIIGNTFPFNKDESFRTMAQSLGEEIAFKGAKRIAPKDAGIVAKLPGAPINSWVTTRRFYNWLLENRADKVRQFNVSIA
ncbi:SNF2-related protein [Undibacterium crateris]|uniref:SNF2-related protein n=1 Tax=Undibacterium crateris TaxID=2528175 RepID=UPI00138A572A|nr:SNF2-related protein [Undibacterium crateris]NDI85070.1 N-6 DNA methylase [Undibacterium crateris]